ncbi:DUF4396 domain-containing protein [Deinococcus deserti]|uniref:DUF4396 domain-containing protein n=1 Tax=Deinococcus deserti (strain DSM 17065 / CIP 109153 / LMG 22923 / VCD115) TaxID=546414 RepID=C1D417_DEIDV|nr:DUF4396 domain-containing protein [Deinococcus deserti]ACO48246.1 Hypothetical protein; putative membrane protein [Deinococcus deserti VCD115]
MDMDMSAMNMLPDWWTPAAWIYLIASVISAGFLAYDLYVRRRRLHVPAMRPVWVVSALFLGPLAILLYARWGLELADGRAGSTRMAWILLALLPGAAASTVAHLIGVPVVFGAGWTIAGDALWAVALFILILATLLLFMFDTAAATGERANHLVRLFLGAFFTVLAFDIGMVGWMLYLHGNGLMQPITDVVFTTQMQIGMLLGMLTALPVAAWLTPKPASGPQAFVP